MSTRGQWVDAFLRTLNVPTTLENHVAILTWIRSEFGDDHPCPAAYNPLATTLKYDGSTKFNNAGVQNFRSFEDGVVANARVLLEDHPGYDAIRSCLIAGHDPDATIDAVHASAWGSKPTRDLVSEVRANYDHNALLLLGDDERGTHPTPNVTAPPFPGVLLRNYTEGNGTQVWQGRMRARGWAIVVDDKYGPESEGVAAQFQAEKGLAVDGVVGPQTWAAAWVMPIT